MKNFFEILTGYEGRSYERAYCWEENEIEARRKFERKYPYRPINKIRRLFGETEDSFITDLSEDGFLVN